jgi:GAF domain-containing protein
MELQSLHDINVILTRLVQAPGQPGDFKSTLQHIGQIALEAFAPDACVIRAYNPLTGKLVEKPGFIGDQSLCNEWLYDEPRPLGVTRRVLNEGLIFIDDLELWPEYHSRFTRAAGVRGLAGFGLFTMQRRKPLGIIYLMYRQPHAFSMTEHESLRILAMQASFLLQETWLSHHYERTARLGQEVNQRLSTVDDLFEALQAYVDSVLDRDHTIFLAVLQPQSHTLDLYIREQERTSRMNSPHLGASQYVIKTQETLLIRHASEEAGSLPCPIVPLEGTLPRESYVFVPLVLRGVSLGVLSIQHGEPDAYGQEDLLIFQLLGNFLALALHNMRLYNGLNQLSETGQLLTRMVESADAVQATVERIQQATQADVVVLYPYDALHGRFVLPPRIAGQLLDPTPYSLYPSRPDDMAVLMLDHAGPIFAKESALLYHELEKEFEKGRLIRQGNFQEREQIRSTAAIRLRVSEETAGVLFINFRQSQRFDATEKLFIEGLALYAAIAIKNAQMFGSLSHRRIRELEILQQIDRELDRNLDLASVLHTLIKLAAEHVEADEAAILFYNARTQELQPQAAIGQSAEMRQKRVFPLRDTKGITRWVLEHKKPVRIDNVLTDPRWREIYVRTEPETRSELDVPLLDGEEVLGVLNVESKREKAFSEQDEHFLLTLAGQALLAIKKAQAYELEKRRAEERRVLNEISKEITSQLDYAHVFDLILEKALSLTGSTLGSLHLYDPERQTLRLVAGRGIASGRADQQQALDHGIIGYVAKTRRWYNIGDVTAPPWNSIYQEFFPGSRSELTGPMLAGTELRGVLNIENPQPDSFNESDVNLMQGLADLAVVALQNAERYEKARREAQRFELLYQAGQELSRITDMDQLEEAYDIILRIATKQSQSVVVIRRYDEEKQELEVVRASQPEYAALYRRTGLDMGINGQVARERRTIVVADVLHPPEGMAIPRPSDPATRSLLSTPILFKERYYGNLGLDSKEVGYFQEADLHFFEGLAQQLASTIHRLETIQARQESEQRAQAAEAMSDIGQMAFELTHRWDNDLGLVRSYVNDIEAEMAQLGFSSPFITRKLENIVQATRTVLDLSKNLKREIAQSGESVTTGALLSRAYTGTEKQQPVHPAELFERASKTAFVPPTIQLKWEIEEEVPMVCVFRNQVVDILRNLITNAVDAMPGGGTITLRARNAGSQVALDVIDTGSGVPAQNKRKIFDLFYSTKGSSGFGLWSARRNALKNHGELRVKSEPGQGTTFTLLLPRGEESLYEATPEQ